LISAVVFTLQQAKTKQEAGQKRSPTETTPNTKCVNRYEFDLESAGLNATVIQFDSADERWLDFICDNRSGKPTGDYDVVIGPVADDKVYRVVVEYENGDIDRETALKNLKTEALCDQILFHTEKALSYLKFLDTEVVEE